MLTHKRLSTANLPPIILDALGSQVMEYTICSPKQWADIYTRLDIGCASYIAIRATGISSPICPLPVPRGDCWRSRSSPGCDEIVSTLESLRWDEP